MMKTRKPQRVAYCWLYYRELSKKDIENIGCTDPEKQQNNPGGLCKYIQFYGVRSEEARRG